jgi:hypothetical protein
MEIGPEVGGGLLGCTIHEMNILTLLVRDWQFQAGDRMRKTGFSVAGLSTQERNWYESWKMRRIGQPETVKAPGE